MPYCFITLNSIYQETEDKELKKAILKFRNSKLFNVVTRRIKRGNGIDYNLISAMDYRSLTFVKIFIQLHVKYIEYTIFKRA
jgi:hypothetical protein